MVVSAVKTWLNQHNALHGAGTFPSTHLFLDGGGAVVQQDLVESFWRVLAHAIVTGERVCCVEVLTQPLFNMFMDIDVRDGNALRDPAALVTELQSILCCPVTPVVCGIQSLNPRTAGCRGGGLHIVWPGMPVTLQEARQLAGNATSTVTAAGAVVDVGVYRSGGGLRMVGCCKGRHGCCVYWPVGWTAPHATPQTIVQAMQACSVRVPGQCVAVPDPRNRARGSTTVPEVIAHALLPKVYHGCVAWHRATVLSRCTLVLPLASRFCHNKGTEHRSNSVYLVLRADGVLRQHCHCTCDVVRPGGNVRCRDYKGKLARVHPLVRRSILQTLLVGGR
jgi:hypothetical protein